MTTRKPYRRREQVLADVLLYGQRGWSAEDICRELDMNPATIARSLHRSRRPELARRFTRLIPPRSNR